MRTERTDAAVDLLLAVADAARAIPTADALAHARGDLEAAFLARAATDPERAGFWRLTCEVLGDTLAAYWADCQGAAHNP